MVERHEILIKIHFALICPINYLQYNETRSAAFALQLGYTRWTMEYGGNETMSNETPTVLYKLIKRYSFVNTYYNLLRQARGHIITERNGMERNKTFI